MSLSCSSACPFAFEGFFAVYDVLRLALKARKTILLGRCRTTLAIHKVILVHRCH